MIIEIKVPQLGESVTEAVIARWLKAEGEEVQADETIVELETDKITLEVNSSTSGVLEKIFQPIGSKVEVGTLLCSIAQGEVASKISGDKSSDKLDAVNVPVPSDTPMQMKDNSSKLSPAVSKMLSEAALSPSAIEGTGKDGRILKGDVLSYANSGNGHMNGEIDYLDEERIPMSRLRQRIASRLKEAQNTAALLTTFNEIDMSAAMSARAKYKDVFEKKHGVKLGFMSFFTKACVMALKEIPVINAVVDGDDILYKYHYDISVAVSSPQGLVVPVIRDADQLSFAEIEKTLGDLTRKAKDNKLTIAELSGGTFTITNGGVFGSLMSTPIINPPQSAILGMHKIQDRAVVVGAEIKIRPMMYVALTYDHRIIDGREAVTFLVRVKDFLEDPERLLYEI